MLISSVKFQRYLKYKAPPIPNWEEEKCEEERSGSVWWVRGTDQLGCTDEVRSVILEEMREDREIQELLLGMGSRPIKKKQPKPRKPRHICRYCDEPFYTDHEFIVSVSLDVVLCADRVYFCVDA